MSDFPYTIEDLRKACKQDQIVWKEHATQRLLQRHILKTEVIQSIAHGEIIEKYLDGKPFDSCLVFGSVALNKPLHTVCSFDGEYIHIITAYIPDKIKFYDDLKTRREK